MIIEPDLDRSELGNQITIVERLTPHTEHFSFAFTGEAGDAAIVIVCSLSCLRDQSVEYAIEASWQAINTVGHYIATRASMGGENLADEEIWTHPLWFRELGMQERLTELLPLSRTPSTEQLDKIRHLSWNECVSNIGLTWSGDSVH
jgi:uncharacterized protein YjaG (DUF416 family)